MISSLESLDAGSNGDDFSPAVGSRNASFLNLNRVSAVQHANISEVQGDGMNADENIIWFKFCGTLLQDLFDGEWLVSHL